MKAGRVKLGRQLAHHSVEIVCGVALVIGGVVAQVRGSTPSSEGTAQPDMVSLITGGILVALGGVMLSWIASKALAERQALQAAQSARNDVDEKLDNLSRVLGQAAGQISQAVEQVELNQVPPSTGFALVSQATRMIYGQVNEIAVIRGVEFDSAYLLQTAGKLDDLARQLSAPGAARDANDEITEVRRQLQEMRASLSGTSTVVPRGYSEAPVECPACGRRNSVRLGTMPGDTMLATCASCSTPFNVHRNAAGDAFSRPLGQPGSQNMSDAPLPVRYLKFQCDQCGKALRAKVDGHPTRVMVCTSCLAYLVVDHHNESVASDGRFERIDVETVGISGSRPKFLCPSCGRTIKTALPFDEGWLGLCLSDRKALVVEGSRFSALLAARSVNGTGHETSIAG
jgi:transposase-like protein